MTSIYIALRCGFVVSLRTKGTNRQLDAQRKVRSDETKFIMDWALRLHIVYAISPGSDGRRLSGRLRHADVGGRGGRMALKELRLSSEPLLQVQLFVVHHAQNALYGHDADSGRLVQVVRHDNGDGAECQQGNVCGNSDKSSS